MNCPKCGVEQSEEKLECKNCGVIFAKLTQEDFGHTPTEIEIKASDPPPKSGWADTIKAYILVSDQEVNPFF